MGSAQNHSLILESGYNSSYTFDMKTAISIPNSLFKEAEQLAQTMKLSRSALYVCAISEFVKAHQASSITQTLNDVYQEESSSLDPAVLTAQIKSLDEEEW